MINVIDFTYTKSDGRKSDRVIVTRYNGDNNIHGIDVTEMSEENSEQLGEFLLAYKQLEDKHNWEIAKLMADHDLKHNYRQFKATGMSNVNIESI